MLPYIKIQLEKDEHKYHWSIFYRLAELAVLTTKAVDRRWTSRNALVPGCRELHSFPSTVVAKTNKIEPRAELPAKSEIATQCDYYGC